MRELDRIVAVVEDDVVLGSELLTRLTTVREQMQREAINKLKTELPDQFICYLSRSMCLPMCRSSVC